MDREDRARRRRRERERAVGKGNPLGMRQLEEKGQWVSPETMSSARRVEFLTRANTFLGFYYVLAATSDQGYKATEAFAKKTQFTGATPIKIGSGVTSITLNYGKFRKVWQSAGRHLTNQVFLMLYENFEAYLTDLVMDGLKEVEPAGDTYNDALNLLVGRKWEGKIARIDNRLGLGLQGTLMREWFKGISMDFLGAPCSQPMDFLEKISDLRDRVVHYSSRVDQGLANDYPGARLKVGDEIGFPFDLPTQFNFFLAHLSDLVDDVFCLRFRWPHSFIRPETLV